MPSKVVAIKKHPDLDWAIAIWDGQPVPTKQEKFKPLKGYHGILEENGEEKVLEELYIRNPDKDSVARFESKLREYIKGNISDGQPYAMPKKVEVILSFTINKKRFFEVDVDNLSKTVLDAIKGLVFEDDSQVVNLLAMKEMHPWDTNGVAIGINLVEDESKSWFNGIKLFYIDENPEVVGSKNK